MASVVLVMPWDVTGQRMPNHPPAPSALHDVKKAVSVGCNNALEHLWLLPEELRWVKTSLTSDLSAEDKLAVTTEGLGKGKGGCWDKCVWGCNSKGAAC